MMDWLVGFIAGLALGVTLLFVLRWIIEDVKGEK